MAESWLTPDQAKPRDEQRTGLLSHTNKAIPVGASQMNPANFLLEDSKLLEKAQITGVKTPNIINPVTNHAEAFNS